MKHKRTIHDWIWSVIFVVVVLSVAYFLSNLSF